MRKRSPLAYADGVPQTRFFWGITGAVDPWNKIYPILTTKTRCRCIERQAAFYGLLCTPSRGTITRSSATAKSTACPLCLVGVLYDIFWRGGEKICCWLINHFYVIGHEFGEIMPIRRSRWFNITDFGANQKPICDFLLVINSNLPSYGWLYVNFSLPIGGQYTLTRCDAGGYPLRISP